MGDIELTSLSNKITVSNDGNNINISAPSPGAQGAGAEWGGITGTLSDQTDLKNQQDTQDTAIGLNTVKNTYPSADATKLAGIEALAEVNTINSGDNVSALVNDVPYISTVSGGDHTTLTNIGTNSHTQIDTHIADIANPHSVTQAQVGLGNNDNTSDADKPVSTAQQTALDAKMGLILGGGLTGIGTAGDPLSIVAFKTINSFDDIAQFKTGSVYNLPADFYLLSGGLAWGTDKINLSEENGIYVIMGSNFTAQTYTGTLPWISTDQTGVSLDIIRLFMTTANATAIKLQAGNSCILEFPVFVGCKICVELDSMGFCTSDKLAMVGCEKGLILNDVATTSCQVGQWSSGQDLSGIAFDISGAASERFFMTSSDSRPASTECFINVAANYGGLVDLVAGVHTAGGGDYFTPAGRNQNDNNISVTAIQNVTSSKSTTAIHISPGDETATSISVGVETLIAGTYTEDIAQRFTTLNSRVTYTGNETVVFGFAMKCLGVPASGNNRDYNFYIRHTAFIGTVETLIPISFDPINADAGTPAKVICIGDIELSTGDFLEPIVIGVGNSINVTCSGLSFIVGP